MPATPATTRRSDARRNEDRIVAAAVECLARDPNATMSRIATEAGVGRVTLYGHFSSREELVERALSEALSAGERVLDAVDLDRDPRQVLTDLIHASWQLLDRSESLLAAAQAVLPPSRVQELHAVPARRVAELIDRGQRLGVFRADLPTQWMVSVLHHVIHGAATDVAAGLLAASEASRCAAATVLGAYAPPDRTAIRTRRERRDPS